MSEKKLAEVLQIKDGEITQRESARKLFEPIFNETWDEYRKRCERERTTPCPQAWAASLESNGDDLPVA